MHRKSPGSVSRHTDLKPKRNAWIRILDTTYGWPVALAEFNRRQVVRRLTWALASGVVLLSMSGCSRPSEAETNVPAPTTTSSTSSPPQITATRQTAQAKWPAFYKAVTDAAAPCDEAYAEFLPSRSDGKQQVFLRATRVSVTCEATKKEIATIARPQVGDEGVRTALDMWAFKIGALALDRAAIAEGFRGLDAPDQAMTNERLIAEEAANASQRDAFLQEAIAIADGGSKS
jgi:hypothetical protein